MKDDTVCAALDPATAVVGSASDRRTDLPCGPAGQSRQRPSVKAWLIAICLAIGLLGSAVGWAAWMTGSLGAGLAYLQGDYVYASLDGSPVTGSDSHDQRIILQNLSSKRIRIAGVGSGCSCLGIDGIPLDLAPRQPGSVLARMSPGEQAKDVTLISMTDEPHQPWIRLRVSVAAKAPPK